MSYEPLKGEFVLKVRQVEMDGEFWGWESELSINGEVFSEITSPTFWGCVDFDAFYADHGYEPGDIIDMEYFGMDLSKEINERYK